MCLFVFKCHIYQLSLCFQVLSEIANLFRVDSGGIFEILYLMVKIHGTDPKR